MKKQYSKTGIIIEDFQIAQNIAIACSGVKPGGSGGTLGSANHADRGSCGWNVGGSIYWTSKETRCNDIVGAEFEVDGYCYHNSTTGLSMFSSM